MEGPKTSQTISYSGRETLCCVAGGMKVKADRDESSPYAAMLAAQDVATRCREIDILLYVYAYVRLAVSNTIAGKTIARMADPLYTLRWKKLIRPGNGTKTPGLGAQAALRALARAGLKIGCIEDVAPTPSDSTRRTGGRRGRRL